MVAGGGSDGDETDPFDLMPPFLLFLSRGNFGLRESIRRGSKEGSPLPSRSCRELRRLIPKYLKRSTTSKQIVKPQGNTVTRRSE